MNVQDHESCSRGLCWVTSGIDRVNRALLPAGASTVRSLSGRGMERSGKMLVEPRASG